jgi:hypothetical protein
VLRQTESFADKLIEHWSFRRPEVEASEVSVTHVVGDDENNVGPIVHRVPSWPHII